LNVVATAARVVVFTPAPLLTISIERP